MRVTSGIAVVGFPLVVFAALYGGYLLGLIHGTPYEKVAGPFAIVLLSVVLRICSVPITSVYLATGHPRLHRRFVGIRALLMVLLIYPAVSAFGLAGAATAAVLSAGIGFIFQAARIRQLTGLDLSKYGAVFLRNLHVFVPGIVVWAATHRVLPSPPLVHVLTGAASCLLAYCLAILVFLRSRSASAANA